MGMKVLTGVPETDRDISTVYTCDLLSRVMSHAEQDCMWITVLTHLNIVAVALLADIACIVIPEDISVDEATINKAKEENIAIASTSMSCYEVCWRMHELLS